MPEADRLFTRELGDETGPTSELMTRLLTAAHALWKAEPWKQDMGDRELIAVDPRDGGERCYCVFMGTLGEVFGMQMYIGSDGYEVYSDVMRGEEVEGAEFLGRLHSLSVELVLQRELTALDKQVVQLGWPAGKGRKPKLRAWRPGYHPWYLNESECVLLADALEAVLSFLAELETSTVTWWTEEGTFPVLRFRNGEWHPEPASAPAPTTGVHDYADPDPALLQAVRDLRRGGGTLEVGHLYGNAAIGEKHERKALMRVAMGIDSKTGMLFAPEIAAPGEKTADLLNRLVLMAIHQRGSIPDKVVSRKPEDAELLQPLARTLGFQANLVRATPHLDEAFSMMMQFLSSR